jgi:hypothetical protein
LACIRRHQAFALAPVPRHVIHHMRMLSVLATTSTTQCTRARDVMIRRFRLFGYQHVFIPVCKECKIFCQGPMCWRRRGSPRCPPPGGTRNIMLATLSTPCQPSCM